MDHAPDRRPWNWETAAGFCEQLKGEYPTIEALVGHEIAIEQTNWQQKPHLFGITASLQAVRVARSDRSRYIQLTANSLMCHFVWTQEKGHEGFQTLKREALAKLRASGEFFKPTRLLQFALHSVEVYNDQLAARLRSLRFIAWPSWKTTIMSGRLTLFSPQASETGGGSRAEVLPGRAAKMSLQNEWELLRCVQEQRPVP